MTTNPSIRYDAFLPDYDIGFVEDKPGNRFNKAAARPVSAPPKENP